MDGPYATETPHDAGQRNPAFTGYAPDEYLASSSSQLYSHNDSGHAPYIGASQSAAYYEAGWERALGYSSTSSYTEDAPLEAFRHNSEHAYADVDHNEIRSAPAVSQDDQRRHYFDEQHEMLRREYWQQYGMEYAQRSASVILQSSSLAVSPPADSPPSSVASPPPSSVADEHPPLSQHTPQYAGGGDIDYTGEDNPAMMARPTASDVRDARAQSVETEQLLQPRLIVPSQRPVRPVLPATSRPATSEGHVRLPPWPIPAHSRSSSGATSQLGVAVSDSLPPLFSHTPIGRPPYKPMSGLTPLMTDVPRGESEHSASTPLDGLEHVAREDRLHRRKDDKRSPYDSPRAVVPSHVRITVVDKKPALACLFCRRRKIACGAPLPGAPERTCNQCARRGLPCEYPTESRRGMRRPRTEVVTPRPEVATPVKEEQSEDAFSGAAVPSVEHDLNFALETSMEAHKVHSHMNSEVKSELSISPSES